MPPEICPNCGTAIPRNAKACPECGADETTGWSEEAEAAHLGLPQAEFNYQEFTEREFGSKSPKPSGIKPFWWVIAVLLLAGMFFFLLHH